jgi:hypothetical protein
VSAIAVLAGVAPVKSRAEGWETYNAGAYGFSLLAPEGAAFQEKEWDTGWGGRYASFEVIELYGLARLGADDKAEGIEKVGVKLTGVPADKWKQIDSGKNKAGWRWYRTVSATGGTKVVFGGYGVGPADSYLLLMVTTNEVFEEHRADYEKWYASVQLGPITDAPKGWKMCKADDFAFRMIVPECTKLEEKEWEGGWAGMIADSEGVKFHGVGRLGEPAKAEDIEKVGMELTGTAKSDWTVIDKGEDRRGCKWYCTAKTKKDGKLAFGGYGVGSKASYLMLLVTTEEDFKKHEREYRTWYASVLLE